LGISYETKISKNIIMGLLLKFKTEYLSQFLELDVPVSPASML
jgi:hypothetical protein